MGEVMAKSAFSEIVDFQNKIINDLNGFLTDEYRIMKKDTYKNNGVLFHGIYIIRENGNFGISIYLDKYWDKYQEEGEFSDIMMRILMQIIMGIHDEPHIMESVSGITDYGQMKDRICCSLINTKANQDFLREIPSIPFFDLSIIFYIRTTMEDGQRSSITVSNKLLAQWKVTKEIVLQDAMKNDLFCVEKITNMLKDMVLEVGKYEMLEEIEELEGLAEKKMLPEMLLASNEYKEYGANSMLCTEKLYEIAQNGDKNLFIFPSSINEIILLPDTGASWDKVMELKDMVKEVNATQLPKEEILSNSVYYFDRKTKEVTLMIPGAEL